MVCSNLAISSIASAVERGVTTNKMEVTNKKKQNAYTHEREVTTTNANKHKNTGKTMDHRLAVYLAMHHVPPFWLAIPCVLGPFYQHWSYTFFSIEQQVLRNETETHRERAEINK